MLLEYIDKIIYLTVVAVEIFLLKVIHWPIHHYSQSSCSRQSKEYILPY